MDSMAPIARADTARTEASDTSPPVTGSDGRGLGVVASAGAGGVSGFSGSHGFSDSHGGQHPHTLPGIVIPAGRRGNTVIPLEPPDEHVPPRPFGGQIHRSAMRVQRPAPILNVPFIAGISQVASNRWLSSSVGTSPPDGLYASSLEGCRDRRTTIRSPSHTADPPRTHTLRCRHTGHDPQGIPIR